MKTLLVPLCALFLVTLVARAQTPASKTQPSTATPPAVMPAKPAPAPAKKKQKNKFDVDRSVDKANESLGHVNNSVNKTSDLVNNTVAAAKNIADKTGAAVPAKKHDAAVAAAPGEANKTEITIKNITFAIASKLNENIQSCHGVQDSKMEFSGSKVTITVAHSNSSAKLLQELQTKSKDVFTEDDIKDFKEGKISIKLK